MKYIIVEKLKQLKVKVVRIYSEQIVQQFYPIPNFASHKQSNLDSVMANADVALHEIVRLPGKPFAEEIAIFDLRFKA